VELLKAESDLTEMGYQVFGIAPNARNSRQLLSLLMGSGLGSLQKASPYKGTPALKIPAIANAVKGRLPANFKILGTRGRRAALLFGASFLEGTNEQEWYWDFNDVNFNGPAVFIIDKNRVVQYSWYWRNHHVRLGAETIVATARQLRDPDRKVFTDWDEALREPADVVRLNLSYQGLDALSPRIAEFVNLQDLRLNGNKLAVLPEEIGMLTKLRRLEVSENKLAALPIGIGRLAALERLEANRNPLKALPPEIGQLARLRRLGLMYCPMESLPPEIGKLASLQMLHLAKHRLKKLPPEIGNLSALVHLLLPGELTAEGERFGLEELPPEIGKLTNLVELHLMFNRLTRLPDEVCNLKKLEKLGVAYNLLEALPAELNRLERLGKGMSEGLRLSHNKLKALPPGQFAKMKIWRLLLDHNELQTLPPGLGNCGELNLSYNRIETLPASLFENLSKWHIATRLDLSHNRITALPAEIGLCKRTDVLKLDDNAITELPAEVFLLPNLRVFTATNNRIQTLPPDFLKAKSVKVARNAIPTEEKRRLRKLWKDARKPAWELGL
jgi:Leucine-rich repeat (LRR) protein